MESNEKRFMDTEKIKMLIVFLLIPLLLGCQQKKTSIVKSFSTEDTLLYRKYKELAYSSIYNYNMRSYLVPILEEQDVEGQKMLDTALCVINKALVDYPNSPYFMEQKMYVLTEKRDFNEAIRAANESNWNVIADSIYPHKEIVINRLKAMKCFHLGKREEALIYIQDNLQLLQRYLKQYEKEINECIKSQDDKTAVEGGYFFVVLQYYRHYALIYGEEKTCKQLRQIKGINHSLLMIVECIIKEDFMKYTMG